MGLMVHHIQITNILFRYTLQMGNGQEQTLIEQIVVLKGSEGIDQIDRVQFGMLVAQQRADLVEFSLDNHQIIPLMSQITVPHASEPPLTPLVPSPYIANYIEQRKALILNKLAHPQPQPHPGINQVFESAVIAQISKAEKVSKGGKAGVQHRRKPSQPVVTETSNKIIKKDNIGSSSQADKFLARSNLYEKQKQLKLQFQKRKHLYNSVSEHRFEQVPSKKDEQLHLKGKEKPTKLEETYYQKHERRASKTTSDQRRNFKDLMKQSMIKYAHQQSKTHPISNQKLRWKEIQEIFQKIRAFQPHLHQKASKPSSHLIAEDNGSPRVIEDEQEAIHQIRLTLRKIESEEQKVNQLVESLQMQHFQEDLSGILMNEDPKEEIDSSHVIQQVVNQMAQSSQSNTFQEKPQNKDEIVRSISILVDECVSEECEDILDEKAEQTQKEAKQEYHKNAEIEMKEDHWIRNEQDNESNQHPVDIRKVESQIIDSPQSHSHEEPYLLVPKEQNQADKCELPLKEISVQESLIDILSEQVLQQSKKEDPQCKIQKVSLEMLANQFIQQNPSPASEDDTDIFIPEEESLPHYLESFQFSTISHQIIGILNPLTPLSTPQPHQEPQVLINGSAMECQDTTGESEELQHQHQQEEPRVTAASRTLRSFGDFLVIPEQSEEQSRQSVG